MKIFTGLLFFIAVQAAAVDIGNPGSFPLGHEEVLRGNTGVAQPGTSAAPYYNPAALETRKGTVLSASSQLLYVNLWELEAQADSERNTILEFGQAPNLTLSFGRGRWGWAFSIYTSVQREIETEITEDLSGEPITTLITKREREILLGLSQAFHVTEKWSFGLTAFFQRYNDNEFTTVKQTDDTEVSDFITILRNNRTVMGAYLVLGTLYRFSDGFSLGLRVQTPAVKLDGSTDHYSAEKGTDKSQPFNSEFSDILDAEQKTPVDGVVGFKWSGGRHSLLFDLGIQAASDFNRVDGGDNGAEVTQRVVTETTARAHAGYIYAASERLQWMAGVQYDPSSIRQEIEDLEAGVTLEKDSQDLWSAAAGFLLRVNKVDFAAGAFYQQGSFTFFETSTSTELRRDSVIRTGGLFFSTGVQF